MKNLFKKIFLLFRKVFFTWLIDDFWPFKNYLNFHFNSPRKREKEKEEIQNFYGIMQWCLVVVEEALSLPLFLFLSLCLSYSLSLSKISTFHLLLIGFMAVIFDLIFNSQTDILFSKWQRNTKMHQTSNFKIFRIKIEILRKEIFYYPLNYEFFHSISKIWK